MVAETSAYFNTPMVRVGEWKLIDGTWRRGKKNGLSVSVRNLPAIVDLWKALLEATQDAADTP